MREQLAPNAIFVGKFKGKEGYSSLRQALLHADPGDTVLVAPGIYSPSTTGESFPLYVPPAVVLVGAGLGETTIDGEGQRELTFQPPRSGESLVLLGDGASISGFTVRNSGGNGIGNEISGSALIENNEICDNAQHGILCIGPRNVTIGSNILRNNGTAKFSPETAHRLFARQGHHIFVLGRTELPNQINVSDNHLSGCFAEGITVACVSDQRVQLRARFLRNTIEQCERNAIAIFGSFGPSGNRLWIDARHNKIHNNAGFAMRVVGGNPATTRLVRYAGVRLDFIGNQCLDNVKGVELVSGIRSSEGNQLNARVLHNTIEARTGHAIRCVAAMRVDAFVPRNNQTFVVIANNRLSCEKGAPIWISDIEGEEHADTKSNEALANIECNERF